MLIKILFEFDHFFKASRLHKKLNSLQYKLDRGLCWVGGLITFVHRYCVDGL